MQQELQSNTYPTAITSNSFRLVDYSAVEKGLFAIHFDLKEEKVNKLSPAVMLELSTLLDQVKANKQIKTLLFLSDKSTIFIAGADINVIQKIFTPADGSKMAREGQSVIQKLEQLNYPVIAAIHGASMGGGTELALCCNWIIASDSEATKIALPEVNLGILPGFGGTVRLPRRIGLQASLDYLLTGKTMNADKAFKLGLADAVLPHQDFHKNAIQFAAKVLRKEIKKRPKKTTVQELLLESNPIGRTLLLSQAKKMVLSKTRGAYPAPLKILEVLAKNFGAGTTKALAIENQAFGELVITEVSKNLINLFFLTENIKKKTGVTGFKLEKTDIIERAGLLGAGVMGGGIAQLLAHRNFPVRMKDIDHKGLALGIASASKVFQGLVKKRKMTKREADIKLALISPTTDYTGFAKTQLVIEAVVENMEIKKKVLKETEAQLPSNALFATNTSSLSVSELAQAAQRPENVVGMHFFNPVHRMPLVEVIRGDKTSDRAVALIFELSKKLGKTPIVVKDGPGFLVNRLLMPYLNEASYLMQEGLNIEELDNHVLDFGMPMGPATLLDEIGIDVAAKVAKILFQAFGDRAKPCALNEKLVDAKLYGKKTQKGFFLYDAQGRRSGLNPEIYKVLQIENRSVSREQKENWTPRLIYPMINEASLCLKEGIAESPADVDLGMIMGTGFPPFRGGVLRYADSIGLDHVCKKLEELAKTVSPRFTPAAPLVELARAKKKFYQ